MATAHRTCTQELKVKTVQRWCAAHFGRRTRVLNVVGLRADGKDATRAKEMLARRPSSRAPLYHAGVTRDDIAAFWRSQPFDLKLAGAWEGNCDGCFLKSRAAIMRMMRDHPDRMEWWTHMESAPRGSSRKPRRFRKDGESYAELASFVARTPLLPLDETMIEGGEPCDGYCGVATTYLTQ
ncbi:MAG: hypothetical protein KGL39_52255 [Patescibacteria group bacterium]|nr:hypothetical protein [Patescibacteria group bacterium]